MQKQCKTQSIYTYVYIYTYLTHLLFISFGRESNYTVLVNKAQSF